MKYMQISLAAALVLLMTAGCGSLGDVLGGGSNPTYPTTSQNTDIQGTVNNVDTRAQRIDINVNSSNGYPGNQITSVYYDSRTQFLYQNRAMSPADLRRGDPIDIRAFNNGNGQYTANTVYVLGGTSGSTNPGTYPGSQQSHIQGTVSYVDTSAQRIDLTSAYATGLRTNSSGNYSVYYDSGTQVQYQGQYYSPTALERGDQVDIVVYDNGNGQFRTSSITVTRNVRG